jgi:hypothetical protein
MSSRMPAPLTAGALKRAVAKRDRRACKALRKATKGNHAARGEVRKISGWVNGKADATTSAIRMAREVVRRALERHQHVDAALLGRLEVAVGRIDLHLEAGRLRVPPDTLAELRMHAAAIVRQLAS